jgi:glutathione synthase/RimK-type ligase-like ATP-grasp enzyme
MAEHVLLVEHRSDWKSHFPNLPVITARDYLNLPEYSAKKQLRVINLCRSYRYLSIGYYCSLLAEARGHKVIPTVRTIQDLSRRSIYTLATEDLDSQVQRVLGRRKVSLQPTAYEVTICFGHTEPKELKDIGRQIFEAFRCPLLKVEFRLQDSWRIDEVKAIPVNSLSAAQEERFFKSLDGYLSQRWRQPRARQLFRYELAILHDPQEAMPPSNTQALRGFVAAGKALGVDVELITRRDYGRLAEYDALFIRETTQINHHTYRFAKKADSEGMVVIDDPDSILRCTNKVYLAELLAANRIPTPKTVIVRREGLDELEQEIPYPIVLKIPDGSFSRGVFKADNHAELRRIATRLFKDSDLILAQEFLYTEYDWRVTVLSRRPIFVCRYFMSKQHWQVVNHDVRGQPREGGFETLRVEDAPPEVVRTAMRAANLIGDGLYGVDLKQTDKGVVVIEVNDNPSIDAGVEDKILKEDLYRTVIEDFVQRLDRRRQTSKSAESVEQRRGAQAP